MEAVAADRAPGFSLLEEKGKTLVLIPLQGTAPTAQEINRAVRTRGPSPDEVVVASVIDLSFLPPVYWLTVGLVLSTAYEKVASELPDGVDPAGLGRARQPRVRREENGPRCGRRGGRRGLQSGLRSPESIRSKRYSR